jgi:hypothetical protein
MQRITRFRVNAGSGSEAQPIDVEHHEGKTLD